MDEPTNLNEVTTDDKYLDLVGTGEFDDLEGPIDPLTDIFVGWRREITTQ